ncbi:CBS domain-containing protein [Bythopirellula polymerisocia]|uniref:Inosine 5'-monophosphate dehydrogenase n=1 Tax=Bythopirellula polymerisocia TaxID=2528003 RepID=A0A5C6CGG8_9BACT|nr:CBS domain-containing protein [Bythopirellula polymerisocia]TWU22817.1 inosine 5'-monophosphate dehydrogenase [Bythopirellula polymerisocia]
MLLAQDIMTKSVMTIGPNALVREAIDILLDNHISGLPVVDAQGKLVGVVTEFALLAIAYNEGIHQEKVLKHMSTELITVGPQELICKVADLCIIHRVRRIPVVQDGRLLGVIARRDVLEGMYRSQEAACEV